MQYTELVGAGSLAGPRIDAGIDAAMEAKLNMSLAELMLSVRASNCLESENIMTVRDLVRRSEDQLLEVRNFGETTLPPKSKTSSASWGSTWECGCRRRPSEPSRKSQLA